MQNEELIAALRSDAEWAHGNEWETPITLGDHLDAAADALERLTAERDTLMRRYHEQVEIIRRRIDAGGLTEEDARLLDDLMLPRQYDRRGPQEAVEGVTENG